MWVSEHAFLRLIDAAVSFKLGHGLLVGRDGGVILEDGSMVSGNTDENFQTVCQGKEASIDVGEAADACPMNCPTPSADPD